MGKQQDVLDFWFPPDAGKDADTHKEYWLYRMRGGADEAIIARFTQTLEEAARGEHDSWAETPRGRLALIVVLDQFPRSVWRDSAKAYSLDERALALCLKGFDNGHYDALETVWEKAFYQMPLGHCEGPDLLERNARAVELGKQILAEAPQHLRPIYEFSAQQPLEHRKVIQAFGRHPHRNKALGRTSTPEELEYLAAGKFPHQREFDV